MPDTDQSGTYRLKTYANVGSNRQHVEAAVEGGWEVYERNRRFVRLRRSVSVAPDAADSSEPASDS